MKYLVARLWVTHFALALLGGVMLVSAALAADSRAVEKNQITILYDAFGKPSTLKKDWGYSALIEYNGKRILFDTGNNAALFKYNVSSLGVDLKDLDFVVISHRHGDHTSGLSEVLKANPDVTIYTPVEISGFGTPIPRRMVDAINQKEPSLPMEMRYFDGVHRDAWPSGSPWPTAHFKQIEETTEITDGIFLISTVSDTPGTKEMHEISLAIRTPKGLVLIVGCSHPGIENIVQEASHIDSHIYAMFGGFHLLTTPEDGVTHITTALHDRWKIGYMAPGHCTGISAFAALRTLYGDKYWYAGLGTTIQLPK